MSYRRSYRRQRRWTWQISHALASAVISHALASVATILPRKMGPIRQPHRRLPFRDIVPGLVTATVLIEGGKSLFGWYISTSTNYDAIYGSMSSIIVLMLWLYFAALVVVYGAEVIAVNGEKE